MKDHHIDLVDTKESKEFDGSDKQTFAEWTFDLLGCLTQADKLLGMVVKAMLVDREVRKGKAKKWNPREWFAKKGWTTVHVTYMGELWTVLCNLTERVAKGYLRKLQEEGMEGELSDGFIALRVLQEEYDGITKCSLLRNYLEVVAPKALRGLTP